MIYLAFLKWAQVVTVAPDIIFVFKMVGRNDYDFVFEIMKTSLFFQPPKKLLTFHELKFEPQLYRWLLAVQGTLKSLLQHHSSKASPAS